MFSFVGLWDAFLRFLSSFCFSIMTVSFGIVRWLSWLPSGGQDLIIGFRRRFGQFLEREE
jgi:hypothetical protein